MKGPNLKRMSLVLSLLLGSSFISTIYASSSSNSTQPTSNVDKEVELLSQQTAALQQQLQQLQAQIADLKAEKASPAAASTASDTTITNTASNDSAKPAPDKTAIPYGGKGDLASLGGTAVITAPFIHSSRQFSGSDLITNYSTIKKNVALLQQRKNFADEMESLGLALPNYPLVELSGDIEGQAFHEDHFDGHDSSDLNLSNSELDVQALVSPWVTGFMSMVYNSGTSDGGRRIDNSNIYLDNGFITVGNFDKSHFYSSLGQMYVPFGSFATYEITDPFNKIMFRTKGRPLVVGYNSTQSTGLDASAYIFKGDVHTSSEDNIDDPSENSSLLNQFGGDLTYHFNVGSTSVGVGGSVINNVSDSNGMQFTGFDDDRFEGFGASSEDEVVKHNVPGADLRFDISAASGLEWIAEYATATESFSPEDLTFNGHGARPSSLHAEGDYHFVMLRKPTTFTLAYDQSAQALALNIPQYGYTAAMSLSWFKNTLESLELHHYVNYSSDDTASGNGGVVFTPPGRNQNEIIAQIDAYF